MDHARKPNAFVGNPIERIEDLRLLRGRGQFIDDLACAGMLHAVVLRSAVAHGRIRSIDAAAARARPGVHAVITAAEIGTVPIIPMRQEPTPVLKPYEQPVIAVDKVRYVGEPIALVVAESAALAEDALEAIVVDIAALPAVADRDAARGNGSILFEQTGTNLAITVTAVRGDAEAAFRDAPYVRRESFKVQRHAAVPMEPRGLLAQWDGAREHITLSGVAKVPFNNRRILAKMMDLPETSVRLVEYDVGGGFGARGEFYPEDFLVPFAARLTGRPVKWIEDRRENLLACNHARDAECELEIACTRDGKILALRGQAYTDVGAYLRTVGATASRNIAQVMSGPYKIADIRIDVGLLVTNKTPSGTYRAPGRYEADFFRERLFDIAARELGIDRVEFRRRNLIAEADMPYPLAKIVNLDIETATDSGDYLITLERCLEEIGWADAVQRQGRLIEGRYHGVAIGCYLEGGASGPKETARLALEADGAVSVFVGSSSVGQGIETVFAQIAADALEMPMERIRGVFHGSTDLVSEGVGSFSSRSVVMGGSAIVLAAAKLRDEIRTAAAARLGCAAGDIAIKHDMARAPGGGALALGELAGISTEGVFASSKRTYSYGAHAAHVAVDPKTGHVELLDYVAVEDVGRIINPLTLHGQCVGAVVQGLGGAFLEHFIYDEDGQLLTGSFADYMLPTATDFPKIRAVAMELKPSPNNPLGAKGAGEGGVIPVGGVIANAVAAALAPLGVEPRELPLSPPRLWQLIQGHA
ncbi:MAG: aerobic carbon-monoxide dehydrogenase large subunit [Alphaproteobacteria bacterium]|jgi:carbon-monoxide dehydrogenase large subunit|nr:aerobic carbon-monoxide dehydrogenase large subunit [Alphaproteobacteria bacterium]